MRKGYRESFHAASKGGYSIEYLIAAYGAGRAAGSGRTFLMAKASGRLSGEKMDDAHEPCAMKPVAGARNRWGQTGRLRVLNKHALGSHQVKANAQSISWK